MRIYDTPVRGDLVVLLTVGCGALHITLTIKADAVFTVIDYRNLSKFQASAGWLCVLTFPPLHTHTHTHTHTGIRHPHTDLSCLIRFLSFLPVWIWINRRKLSTGWIQRHAPPSSSSSSLSPFPPSLSLSLSLYRSAVCRCAAVCNRFFSAALQPEASTGLSGRKSITAGLSLACGGAYGREIRT